MCHDSGDEEPDQPAHRREVDAVELEFVAQQRNRIADDGAQIADGLGTWRSLLH